MATSGVEPDTLWSRCEDFILPFLCPRELAILAGVGLRFKDLTEIEAKHRVQLLKWASSLGVQATPGSSWALLAHALFLQQCCCSSTALNQSDLSLLHTRVVELKASDEKYEGIELEVLFEDVRKAARPCLSVELGVGDDYSEVGCSRSGGLPDLPPGMKWPCSTWHPGSEGRTGLPLLDVPGRSVAVAPLEVEGGEAYPLTFVAQINLEEAARAYGDPAANPLPPHGILYIFFGDVLGREEARVLFHPGPVDTSLTLSQPLNRCDFDEPSPDGGYAARRLNLRRGLLQLYLDRPDADEVNPIPDWTGATNTLFDNCGFGSRMLGPPCTEACGAVDRALHIALLHVPSWGDMNWGDAQYISLSLDARSLIRRDFSELVVHQDDYQPVFDQPWNA